MAGAVFDILRFQWIFAGLNVPRVFARDEASFQCSLGRELTLEIGVAKELSSEVMLLREATLETSLCQELSTAVSIGRELTEEVER